MDVTLDLAVLMWIVIATAIVVAYLVSLQIPNAQKQWWNAHPEYKGLAEYNSERARGLAHTAEKDAEMKKLQARYDEEIHAQPWWMLDE